MAEIPEFKPEAAEVWASVGLTGLLVLIATYASWVASSFGATASFHLTHGIVASWTGFLGVQVSVLAAILAWRGFGLNAVAALLGSSALSEALIDGRLYRVAISVILAAVWLIAAIYWTRRFFEHNPFLTFVSLWGLTFTSSLSQSIFYRLLFDHAYPLEGVLLLKLFLFSLGGLILFFVFPRKNKVYVI